MNFQKINYTFLVFDIDFVFSRRCGTIKPPTLITYRTSTIRVMLLQQIIDRGQFAKDPVQYNRQNALDLLGAPRPALSQGGVDIGDL